MGAVDEAVGRIQVHDEPSIVVGVGPPRPGPVDHVLGRIRTEAERLAARAEGIEGRDWLRCGRRPSGQQVSAMDLVRHAVHVGAHHRTVMEGVMAAVLLRPDSAGDRAQTDKGGSAMRRTNTAESGSDRVALAKDAGMGRISLFGVLAGTLVAYGAFLVLASVVAAVANAVGVSDKVATLNWEEMGVTAGLIVAAVLLLSYLFGGYVAGRMARRAGALNGFLVFVLGVLVAVGVSLLVNLIADGDEAARNFRNAGIPTSGEEWGNAGTVAGIASLLAIVIGPILGGSWASAGTPSLSTGPSTPPSAPRPATANKPRITNVAQTNGTRAPRPERSVRRRRPGPRPMASLTKTRSATTKAPAARLPQ